MQKRRILIVDDQADLRKLIVLTLGREKYELLEAADGASALAAVQQAAPELVLLDLMLPGGLDGIQIAERIRAEPALAATRIVLLTAADQAVQRERAAAAGVDHYFPKPFSPRQLRELVESLLDAGQPD